MLNIDLTGKIAIVSGSSAGIGWGCAKSLATAGATVVLTGNDEEKLNHGAERLREAVSRAVVRTVSADLSIAAGCNALLVAEPACDILVNNLGVYQPKPFFEASDEDWEQLFQINVMSGVRLSRLYMPGMIQRGWGRIVLVSSVDAVTVPVDSLHYGVTKAGVLALSRGLAKLAGRAGVTVNAVLPGVTAAEWVEGMIDDLAQKQGEASDEVGHTLVLKRYPTSITQRVQDVEEVANLVTYLCSPLSSATTGSALRAEGGIIETLH